jgi:hypothetical protein
MDNIDRQNFHLLHIETLNKPNRQMFKDVVLDHRNEDCLRMVMVDQVVTTTKRCDREGT